MQFFPNYLKQIKEDVNSSFGAHSRRPAWPRY
jgi:hypothetical protein